jgi:hypothetical protein
MGKGTERCMNTVHVGRGNGGVVEAGTKEVERMQSWKLQWEQRVDLVWVSDLDVIVHCISRTEIR